MSKLDKIKKQPNKKKNKKPTSIKSDKHEEEDMMEMLADLSEADMSSADYSDDEANEDMEESDDNDSQPIKRKIRKNDDEGVERKKIKNLATSDDSEEVDDEEGEESPQKMKPSRRQVLKERIADRRATEERTIFIGNALAGTSRKTIRNMFKPFGTIEAVYQRSRLQMTEKMTKLMVGKYKELRERLKESTTTTTFYVRYTEKHEAENAAKQMNGTILDGHLLRVTMSNKHKVDNSRSIFIGNLPFQATEDQVRSHFSQIGPVASVRLLFNKATAQNSGAGYVEFDEKETVIKALTMNGQKFAGREMRISKVFQKKKIPKLGLSHRGKGGKQMRKCRNGRPSELPAGAEKYLVLKGPHGKAKQQHEGEETPKKILSKKVRKEIRKRKTNKQKSLIT